MTHDTDALVTELRVRAAAYEDKLAGRAADAIARLTRERDNTKAALQISADLLRSFSDENVTLKAALSAARAELAECRNKAMEEAAVWHDQTAAAWEACYQESHRLGFRDSAIKDAMRQNEHIAAARHFRALKEAPHE